MQYNQIRNTKLYLHTLYNGFEKDINIIPLYIKAQKIKRLNILTENGSNTL